jgi:hypothetical protein
MITVNESNAEIYYHSPSKLTKLCPYIFDGVNFSGIVITIDNMSLVGESSEAFVYSDINRNSSVDSIDFILLYCILV